MDNKLFRVNVSVVILNENYQVLIMKRSQNEDVFPGFWGIPGGTLEHSDKSLEDCLRREVQEEVGVEIEDINLLSNNTRTKDDENKLYLVYSANYSSGSPCPSEECEKVDWFSFEQMKDLNFTPFTLETIQSVLFSKV